MYGDLRTDIPTLKAERERKKSRVCESTSSPGPFSQKCLYMATDPAVSIYYIVIYTLTILNFLSSIFPGVKGSSVQFGNKSRYL
ncbi:hypothetical protein P280DRAFT_265649 [Massarina eburnea CBS 473.64]|uniref:Uncharacterized protein n=1 Tax=Massarina eburnea CBS 473.64 TaxID=1395130 RepID=A0A6A6S429_9PLEO|nr:hypothetical protein P280DRAFT_265649 [Massarina eburnea CBS 473.64]